MDPPQYELGLSTLIPIPAVGNEKKGLVGLSSLLVYLHIGDEGFYT